MAHWLNMISIYLKKGVGASGLQLH